MLTPHQVTFEQYTQAIMDGNATHARLTALNQNVVFDDSDIEGTGLTLTSYFNADEDLTMGRAVMDELNISLFRTEKMTGLNWGDEFRLEMGVDIEGTTYWETVGYYRGKKPERSVTDEVIRFQLVDRMIRLEIPADDYLRTLDWAGGVTIAQLYHGICTYCGVTWEAGNELTNIMNRGYVTAMLVGNGYTCREIIAWIAEACGCYARFGANGSMKMVWFGDHMDDYTVYRSHEFSIYVSEIEIISDPSKERKKWADLEMYTWGELSQYLWGELEGNVTPFKIMALNVRQMEDDSGIMIPSAATSGVYMIVDNPFLATANATEETNYLWPIYRRLNGFGSYIPMSVECMGNWLIEPGDVITVEVGRGNMVRCPIFTREFRWNGGARDVYEATGNLERETVSPYTNRKMVEGGRMHVVRQTVDEMYERIQDALGNYSTREQTAEAIALAVAKTSVILYDTSAPTGINRDAELYSSQQTYEVGDFCLHAGKSWRCTVEIATPESWNDSHWEVDQLPLTAETIWVDISEYLQTEADDYDPTATYSVGDLCKYNGSVYKCNTAIETPEAWSAVHWDLYENPVSKNEWHRWNGTAWEVVSENTTYTRQSGIEITADGVEISGDKYIHLRSGESYWSYTSRGVTYYYNGANSFRIGATTNTQITSKSGVYDYLEEAYSAGYKKHSTMIHSSCMSTSQLIMAYLYWAVDNIDNGYRGVLRPKSGGCYLGTSSVYWDRAYLNAIYSNGISVSGSVSTSGSVYTSSLVPYSGNYINIPIGSYSFYFSLDSSGAWFAGRQNNTFLSAGTVEAINYNQRSSKAVKHNIKSLYDVGDIIEKLRPVSFIYDDDEEERKRFGLIYEEVIKVLPEVCNDTGRSTGINYIALIPVLLKEIQILRKRVSELENKEG